MKLFNLIIPLIFFYSCSVPSENLNVSLVGEKKLYFDAVEKELILNQSIPIQISSLANSWFSNYVKINGITGRLKLELKDYVESISFIDDGKRVDLKMKFYLSISDTNNEKSFKGDISTFSEINGDFSLSEFDDLVTKTQIDLFNLLIKSLDRDF